ncbi:RNA helicase Mov10l1, partial [Varanus komodoensis]
MGWMRANKLKLNPDKMEVLLVGGLGFREGELNLVLSGVALPLREKVRSLGVLLDPELSLEAQVTAVARSAFLQLRLIHQLRLYLEYDCLATVTHALVTSRLDFCNALYVGLPLKTVQILQLVQNTAARLLMGTGHYVHMTPVLRQLHWLPIEVRAQFKVLVMTCKALNGLGPGYLKERLRPYTPACPLRSAGEALLREPSMKEIRRVHISSVCGKIGVVDDSVFFTLDFLRLPDGYFPKKHDLVNVVVVESNQSCYIWRALCMAPADTNGVSLTQGINMNEPCENVLMKDKEGLEVSQLTNFGNVKLGECKSMDVWIENKGKATHSLISCKLGGWDKMNQFSLQVPGKDQKSSTVSPASSVVPKEAVTEFGPVYINSGENQDSSIITQPEKLRCEKARKENEEKKTDPSKDISLPSGTKISIEILCTAKNPGHCKELLLLCFSDCIIGRYIEATIVTEEESLIAVSKPFCPRKCQVTAEQQNIRTTVVLAQYCKRSVRRQLPSFIPHYPIPDSLMKCVEKKLDILVFHPHLGEGLTLANYKAKFSSLLWLEEIHEEMEMKDFSMYGVTLKRNGNFLVLDVPGVTEGRPPLGSGDRVILKTQEYSEQRIYYIAYITEIHDEEVTLRLNPEFEERYNSEPMDVEFLVNRTTSQRCHFAVEQAIYLGEKVLFPDSLTVQSPQIVKEWNDSEGAYSAQMQTITQEAKNENEKMQNSNGKKMPKYKKAVVSDVVTVASQTINGIASPNTRDCDFFNPLLNKHQKLAVKRILGGECRPTPYILFGPPGTGKTVTVIEAVLQ